MKERPESALLAPPQASFRRVFGARASVLGHNQKQVNGFSRAGPTSDERLQVQPEELFQSLRSHSCKAFNRSIYGEATLTFPNSGSPEKTP